MCQDASACRSARGGAAALVREEGVGQGRSKQKQIPRRQSINAMVAVEQCCEYGAAWMGQPFGSPLTVAHNSTRSIRPFSKTENCFCSKKRPGPKPACRGDVASPSGAAAVGEDVDGSPALVVHVGRGYL